MSGSAMQVARDRPHGALGIGLTRWATHGRPSDTNPHPHVDCRSTSQRSLGQTRDILVWDDGEFAVLTADGIAMRAPGRHACSAIPWRPREARKRGCDVDQPRNLAKSVTSNDHSSPSDG